MPYATLYVIHEGQRYTLAVTRVDKGEKMPEVTKRLLRMARARGLKLRVLLLDRGFFSTEVLRNVWVWLHYFIFADERGETPSLRLELLRFRRMLDWLASVESDK